MKNIWKLQLMDTENTITEELQEAEEINFDKAYQEPFIEDLPESLGRVRKNLLLYSSISILLMVLEFLGKVGKSIKIKIPIIEPESISIDLYLCYIILFLIQIYYFSYFSIKSWENYIKHKLRLTGIFHETPSGVGDSASMTHYGRIPDKFRQHTLHVLIKDLLEDLRKYPNELSKQKLLGLETSLSRFNKGFSRYKKIEKLRYVWWDLMVPIIFASISLLGCSLIFLRLFR